MYGDDFLDYLLSLYVTGPSRTPLKLAPFNTEGTLNSGYTVVCNDWTVPANKSQFFNTNNVQFPVLSSSLGSLRGFAAYADGTAFPTSIRDCLFTFILPTPVDTADGDQIVVFAGNLIQNLDRQTEY